MPLYIQGYPWSGRNGCQEERQQRPEHSSESTLGRGSAIARWHLQLHLATIAGQRYILSPSHAQLVSSLWMLGVFLGLAPHLLQHRTGKGKHKKNKAKDTKGDGAPPAPQAWPPAKHAAAVSPKDTWTPERYPRLLLMHLAPLGPKVQKSFNYNKLRMLLVSRVRVGVQLDSDQFVAPGRADYMFNMTEREITKDYPIPILPVHYFSFTQKDAPSNIWWRRFCPDPPKCESHSMRWSHAHPTWTFWALPWIGQLLKWDPSMGSKCPFGTGCSNIMSDVRFYPKGAAKAHFTAHNAKDPKETARRHLPMWIDRINARYKKGLYPSKVIVYQAARAKGRLFSDGEELRKEFPAMPCLL
eukprot:Skav232703  [mRNA]  locus=scaffold3459:28035:42542:- [translate_table: standard]